MLSARTPVGEEYSRSAVSGEIPHVSWWFWIKAGMGFTLGAGLVGVVATVMGWMIGLGMLGFFGALFRPR